MNIFPKKDKDFKKVFKKRYEECNPDELSHISNEISSPELKKIDKMYGVANSISLENQSGYYRTLKYFAVIGTLIAAFFLVYDSMDRYFFIVPCLVMIFCLVALLFWADSSQYHRKYLEFRVLAESFRVQFFLSAAAVQKNVVEILPWSVQMDMPWICEILKKEITLSDYEENKNIINFMIRNQISYNEYAFKKTEKNYRKNKNYTKVIRIIMLASYLFLALFELYVLYASPSIDVDFWRMILKVTLGSASVAMLLRESYYGKMALDEKCRDHEHMMELYIKIEEKIIHRNDPDILLELAHEFVIENSAWYAYQSQNDLDLII